MLVNPCFKWIAFGTFWEGVWGSEFMYINVTSVASFNVEHQQRLWVPESSLIQYPNLLLLEWKKDEKLFKLPEPIDSPPGWTFQEHFVCSRNSSWHSPDIHSGPRVCSVSSSSSWRQFLSPDTLSASRKKSFITQKVIKKS